MTNKKYYWNLLGMAVTLMLSVGFASYGSDDDDCILQNLYNTVVFTRDAIA